LDALKLLYNHFYPEHNQSPLSALAGQIVQPGTLSENDLKFLLLVHLAAIYAIKHG
jgi:hypothetical protein